METFDWHDRLYLVLEICSGGDLYTRDPYTEEQAQKIIRSLLSAVAYLHDHDIIHRDLKFENIMFSDARPEAIIKLIDFGLSQKFARNEHLRDAVGTGTFRRSCRFGCRASVLDHSLSVCFLT